MTIADLLAQRDEAGAAYREAVLRLKAAYIRLAGVERALVNSHIGGGRDIQTFATGTDVDVWPSPLMHPTYVLQSDIGPPRWSDAADSLRDSLVAQFTRAA